MNFFELLGVSSDQLADSMPERIVEAFHAGGKEAVREVVYGEVAERLRAPLHVRSTEPGGGEAVYGGALPGPPVYLVKDAKDLFARVHEDGSPYEHRGGVGGAGGDAGGLGGGFGGGGAARARKPRPSGGALGPSARDKERDATWEAKYQNLLNFVRTQGHRPRRTGADKERQMCFWLAQQQRKMKDGSLTDDKRDKLLTVLAVKGPAGAGGGGRGGSRGYGGSEGGEDEEDGDFGDGDGAGEDEDDDGGDDDGGYDD